MWRSWGLFNFINISMTKVEMDHALLSSVMPFWSLLVNGSSFPFGMISPIVYDLLVIFGLLVDGLKQVVNPLVSAPACQLIVVTFSQYVANNMKKGEMIEHEHAAFLLAWMSEYIACTSSHQVVLEYACYVQRILNVDYKINYGQTIFNKNCHWYFVVPNLTNYRSRHRQLYLSLEYSQGSS